MNLIARASRYFAYHNYFDNLRKVTYFVTLLFYDLFGFFRKIRFYFFTKSWAKNIHGKVNFIGIGNAVRFGKGATFYPNTIIELSENAELQVGKNFTMSYGAILACNKSIHIGDDVLIGEYTSVRDTTHRFDVEGVSIRTSGDKSQAISIGSGAWIGRGCIILPGTIIEEGVVVGANSVVKGHLVQNSIYAGSPAKCIKKRF